MATNNNTHPAFSAVKFNDHLSGSHYFEAEQLRVDFQNSSLRITDISQAMKPGQKCRQVAVQSDDRYSCDVANILWFSYKGEVTRLFADLQAAAPANQRDARTEFAGYTVNVYSSTKESKRLYSPFAKLNPLKEVPAKWTIPHVVRALMSGQYTSCTCDGRYTDDYRGDAANNFGKGEADAQDLAEKLVDSPSGWWVSPGRNGKIGVSCHHFLNYSFSFSLTPPAPTAPAAEPAQVVVATEPEAVAEPVASIEPAQVVVATEPEPAPAPLPLLAALAQVMQVSHRAAAPTEEREYGPQLRTSEREKREAEASGYPIPGLYQLAYRAHSGTSYSPEKRAATYTREYQRYLENDRAKIQLAGEAAGADAERITEAVERYTAGYIVKLNAWLSAKSRCISTMITGGSNFPVRRAQKANESEHNRCKEFIYYYENNLDRAIRSVKAPRLSTEQQAAAAEQTAASARPFELNGWTGEVVINPEVDRVQLLFDGKPDEETRSQLKKNGFKWSPRFSAWQRQNTPNGRHAVYLLTGVDMSKPAPVVSQAPVATTEPKAAPEPAPAPVATEREPFDPYSWPHFTEVRAEQDAAAAAQTGWSSTKPEKTKHHYYQSGVKSCNYEAEEVKENGQFVTRAEAEQSAGGICSSCLNNLHKEQQAAKKANPAPRPAAPAPAPVPAQLDLFSQAAPTEPVPAAPAQVMVATAQEPAPDTVVTPENQAIVTARALAGKLTDAQRKKLKWLGFQVPEYVVKEATPKWRPMPAPVTDAAELAALVAGAAGPATAAQVYELPPLHPLRRAYDETPRIQYFVTIHAAGREWAVSGNAWHRYAGMTDRSRANNPRRARLEAERTEKKRDELNAQLHKAGPLAVTFYGVPEAPKPRYTTAEEAEAHEMRRRQQATDQHRKYRAEQIHRIRRQLDCLPAAELARLYTDWQRRTGGHGPEYLLDALHQHQRAKATAAGMSATEAREYALERTRNPQPEPTSRAAEAAAGGPAASATLPGFEPGKVAAFGLNTNQLLISRTNGNRNTSPNHRPRRPAGTGTPQPKKRPVFHPAPRPRGGPRGHRKPAKCHVQGAPWWPRARAARTLQERPRLCHRHLYRGPDHRHRGRELLPVHGPPFLPQRRPPAGIYRQHRPADGGPGLRAR